MPEPIVQNFANHRRFDKVYIGSALILLIVLLYALLNVFRAFGIASIMQFLFVVAVVGMLLRLRPYSLKMQDRIIRLEMRLRLREVLTGALAGRINELTVRQLVGLRYASDEELPALVEKVLAERIEKADDIKKLVKNWQADDQRV